MFLIFYIELLELFALSDLFTPTFSTIS